MIDALNWNQTHRTVFNNIQFPFFAFRFEVNRFEIIFSVNPFLLRVRWFEQFNHRIFHAQAIQMGVVEEIKLIGIFHRIQSAFAHVDGIDLFDGQIVGEFLAQVGEKQNKPRTKQQKSTQTEYRNMAIYQSTPIPEKQRKKQAYQYIRLETNEQQNSRNQKYRFAFRGQFSQQSTRN